MYFLSFKIHWLGCAWLLTSPFFEVLNPSPNVFARCSNLQLKETLCFQIQVYLQNEGADRNKRGRISVCLHVPGPWVFESHFPRFWCINKQRTTAGRLLQVILLVQGQKKFLLKKHLTFVGLHLMPKSRISGWSELKLLYCLVVDKDVYS